jgi:hypothetical protein
VLVLLVIDTLLLHQLLLESCSVLPLLNQGSQQLFLAHGVGGALKVATKCLLHQLRGL